MAEMHAIKAADQLAPLPDLDRVAMTECEQIAVEAPDPPVDPGATPARAGRGAAFDHRLEGLVDLDLHAAVPDGARQPSGSNARVGAAGSPAALARSNT